MEKSKHDLVLEGLNGRIINDFIEGWEFQVREVSSNFYRVDAKSSNGYTALGVGIDPDKAFEDCIKAVERIMAFQGIRLRIKSILNTLLTRRK